MRTMSHDPSFPQSHHPPALMLRCSIKSSYSLDNRLIVKKKKKRSLSASSETLDEFPTFGKQSGYPLVLFSVLICLAPHSLLQHWLQHMQVQYSVWQYLAVSIQYKIQSEMIQRNNPGHFNSQKRTLCI